jgi:hypothetical protein
LNFAISRAPLKPHRTIDLDELFEGLRTEFQANIAGRLPGRGWPIDRM